MKPKEPGGKQYKEDSDQGGYTKEVFIFTNLLNP